MVVIRTLQPSVRIRMPGRSSDRLVVRRRLTDHPAPTPQPTPCRLWQGAVDDKGYGTFWEITPDESRRKLRPHRWVFEQVLGRHLEPSEVIMHLCDQPLCYRYDHLKLGTLAENNADMMAKGRYVHGGGPKRRLSRNVTPQTAAKIRQMYLSGLYQKSIADELSVPMSVVRRELAGMTDSWKFYRAR